VKQLSSYRQQWNEQQRRLRPMLLSSGSFEPARKLFLSQHAMLHSARMTGANSWSYEDAIFDEMNEAQIRCIPQEDAHSAAWLLWHMARIEDVTMNLLVAGTPQTLYQAGWLAQMNVTIQDTGNAMDEVSIADLSSTIEIDALRAYRLAVGRRTREIVQQLSPEALPEKVDKDSLDRIMAEGAVAEASRGLLDYWGRRTKAGLLLMPATRHNFIHLNEALRLKEKLQSMTTA
jgi:uncharacterized protein YidB (DUF937 family)